MQRMNQSVWTRCAAVGVVAAMSGAQVAMATVTPGTLFGDSYIVTDGAKTYSVLDVYIKCSSAADIISSTFGTSAFKSANACAQHFPCALNSLRCSLCPPPRTLARLPLAARRPRLPQVSSSYPQATCRRVVACFQHRRLLTR